MRERDGVRTVTVNIHQAVPGGRELDPDHHDIDALRDVAAYVNSVDPDVVAVQEVNDRKPGAGGIPHQASVLFHLLDADDMAFTPALGHTGAAADEDREYGTATFTRNGYRIEQAHNVDLPNRGGDIEDRSAGVAVVRPPDGGERFTVVNAHLTAGSDEGDLRQDQLDALTRVLDDARDGSFSYRDAISEGDSRATSLPVDGDVIFAGDLNSRRGPVDDAIAGSGLEHAHHPASSPWHILPGVDPATTEGIDHIYYSRGIESRSWGVHDIPNDEFEAEDGATPTDHPLVVSDAVLGE